MTDIDLANLEPGDVPITRPTDNVELAFHGLADNSGGSMLIEAMYERETGGDSFYLYRITDLNDDETQFIVEPDGPRNTHVEDAIRNTGGEIRT